MFVRMVVLSVGLVIVAANTSLSSAQELMESYVARLGEADHFSSSGQRLTTAAAVVRQDRANYHRFNIRDPEDEDDRFFADEKNRAALEKMLERGRADPGVLSRIVNGAPLVKVYIYRNGDVPFVQVTVLDDARGGAALNKPDDVPKDYTGPFTTEFLYSMCSQSDTNSREKCNFYLQGLLYGLNIQRAMQRSGTPICPSGVSPEAARLRILEFIDGVTNGKPSNNKDGGDWIALMGIAAGSACK